MILYKFSDLKSKYKVIIQFLSTINYTFTENGNLWFECDAKKLETIINDDADVFDDFTQDNNGFKLTNLNNEILGFIIYPSKENFYENFRRFINSRKPTIVIDEKANSFYGYIDEICFRNEIMVNDKNFFSDILNYSKFEKLWIAEAEKNESENNLFHFIDHHNTSKDSFLLISNRSRAIIKMPFKFKINKATNEIIDSEKNLNNLKTLLEDEKDKTIHFLKNEIIKRSKFNSNNLLKVFWSFDEIYRSAYKSYMIFIEDISLEKLQNEYDEFKREYLKSYSD
ncbi:hypothetical protein, partial [Mesonia sp.]|uniref:hypothetical protein n=1 Tax=Mesonia sp. TaxID=1960830 RepID=UPI0017628DBA